MKEQQPHEQPHGLGIYRTNNVVKHKPGRREAAVVFISSPELKPTQ